MKLIIALLVISLGNSESLKQSEVAGSKNRIKEPNDIGVERLSSSHRSIHHHGPLPPVVIPGIINGFEPSMVHNKARKMPISELRHLKNQYLPLDKIPKRIKRSPLHPVPQITTFIKQRNRRDLRRLRRDLGYDHTPEEFSTYQKSYYRPPPSVYGQQWSHQPEAMRELELERLLQEFLAQYAHMPETQDRGGMGLGGGLPVSSTGEQRRLIHAPPSRFAPQPKIFIDDEFENQASRIQSPIETSDNQSEQMLWLPKKRWPTSHGSLSMVPGFKKRSVFREATQQRMNQRSKRQKKKVSSLASFLGGEKDSAVDNIRRTAM